MTEFNQQCFVAMPFGNNRIICWIDTGNIKETTVDFDLIYRGLFEKAIKAASTDSGTLEPLRVDMEEYSKIIDKKMLQGLVWSRLCLVDISAPNQNVYWELGVRHALAQGRTVLVRKKDTAPAPFDVNRVSVFEYEWPVLDEAREIHRLKEFLEKSLHEIETDSPVQHALVLDLEWRLTSGKMTVMGTTDADSEVARAKSLFSKAEKALAQNRVSEVKSSLGELQTLILTGQQHYQMGRLFRCMGDWGKAAEEFKKATKMTPKDASAWRELGVALHKSQDPKSSAAASQTPDWWFEANSAFEKATTINKDDFDAWSSWGGLFKTVEKYQRQQVGCDEAANFALANAVRYYEKAQEIAPDPYPFINLVILRAQRDGRLILNEADRKLLNDAIKLRENQRAAKEDEPWASFDLSTALLLLGEPPAVPLEILEETVASIPPSNNWMITTHHNTLAKLQDIADQSWVSEALKLVK